MPAADPRAHQQVTRALRDGRLVKPDRCEKCGTVPQTKRSLHAHHDDYSKPLEVRWLCPKCHRREPVGINGRNDLPREHNLRLSDELWEQVEQRRGKVPRNPWIIGVLQEAVEQAAGFAKSERDGMASRNDDPAGPSLAPAPAEQPLDRLSHAPVSESGTPDTPTPYRQSVPGPNVENIRSTSQREFRPYPKAADRKKKR